MINLNDIRKDRNIRVFISSTFRDFQKERELLIKQVFPKIRNLCAERNIDFMEIDLRWGVTEAQVQQGAVIDIILEAIERCHPYFICLIGSRYGWVPTEANIAKYKWFDSKYPFLKGILEQQLSITEIEIQYGVLQRKSSLPVSFFYFRNDSATLPQFKEIEGSAEQQKLQKLTETIRARTDIPSRDFSDNEQLAYQVEKDLMEHIDTVFPARPPLSLLERQREEHASFARSRIKIYIPDADLIILMNKYSMQSSLTLVVHGEQGCGKTALIANWIASHQKMNPKTFILYHFIGGATASTGIHDILRRICEEIREEFNIAEEIPDTNEKLVAQFPQWLAKPPLACSWILVLDALNQMEPEGNALQLNWLPRQLPGNLKLIVSTTPGSILELCEERGYLLFHCKAPKVLQKIDIVEKYLKNYEKELPIPATQRIANSKITDNVLVLRTLLDELRLFGDYERLEKRISYHLEANSCMEFFQKVLERYEKDYEANSPGLVRDTFCLLWASHMGLSEAEILELTGAAPLHWTPFREAVRNHFVNRGSLLNFSHDYLRQAVEQRYLNAPNDRKRYHKRLLENFSDKQHSYRSFEETPFHIKYLKDWGLLKNYLTDPELYQYISVDKVHLEIFSYWRLLDGKYDMEEEYMRMIKECRGTVKIQQVEEGVVLKSDYFSRLKDKFIIYGVICSQVARLLYATSKFNTAIPLLQESCDVLDYSTYANPEIYATAIGTKNLLINIYMKQGHFDKAEPLLSIAIEKAEKYLGEADTMVGIFNGTLGLLYYYKQEYDLAEIHLDRSLEIHRKVNGENSVETATCYNNLALLYHATGRRTIAETYLHRAIDIRTLHYGRQHPETVTCLTNLVMFLILNNKTEEAFPIAREVIASSIQVFDRFSPETARAYSMLAACYADIEENEEAVERYRIAYLISKQTLTENNVTTGEYLQCLAGCLAKLDRFSEAFECYSKALDIFKTTVGDEHQLTRLASMQVASFGNFV
jgi:nephrocystin-3